VKIKFFVLDTFSSNLLVGVIYGNSPDVKNLSNVISHQIRSAILQKYDFSHPGVLESQLMLTPD